MTDFREFQLDSGDGLPPRHVYFWRPEAQRPKAVVQLVHGISEHIMRYEALALFLTERGYAVVGHDHFGHGKSAPDETSRGDLPEKKGWDRLVVDVKGVRDICAKEMPGVPHVIFGHSMGSFVVRTYMYSFPKDDVAGYILSGTGQPGGATLGGGKLLARLEMLLHGGAHRSERLFNLSMGGYNKVFEPTRTENDWISSDTAEVDAYGADPLCGGRPTLRLMHQMMDGLQRISYPDHLRRMNRTIPVLFLFGGADPVGENGKGVERVVNMFVGAGYPMGKLTLKKYENMRHELFREPVREQVMADMLIWLEGLTT